MAKRIGQDGPSGKIRGDVPGLGEYPSSDHVVEQVYRHVYRSSKSSMSIGSKEPREEARSQSRKETGAQHGEQSRHWEAQGSQKHK